MNSNMNVDQNRRLFDEDGEPNETSSHTHPRPESASSRRTAPTNRRLYTITEAADLLGIGRSTAYELAQRGDLDVVRIGGRRLVSPTVLEGLLGERPPPPSDLT